MKAVSLASGSKGNCYLIFTDKTKILIDDGINFKELCEKLDLLKINPQNIDAVFISHEHDDHIKGLLTLLKNYSPKIFIHNDCVNFANQKLKNSLKNVTTFVDNENISLNDLLIENFKQSHDSKHCNGFSILSPDGKVSVSTDIGVANQNQVNHLSNSNLVYLEANHDVNLLLDNMNYPAFLKRRILSDKGHLSNKASAEIIENLSFNKVNQVVLSHLSEENNSPSLAYNYIKNELLDKDIVEGKDIFIDVASQYRIGTIFNIIKK